MLRVGILGAARIAPTALVKPARRTGRVQVTAVAARDPQRAEQFAHKNGIPRVLATYADLVNDPELDAVYNPLPNGLHGHWTIAAIKAGKHVLCEKPFTANANEARAVAEAVNGNPGLVVMEAFHYQYHPFCRRLVEIVRSGELGNIANIDVA
ncbi:MAG TPA: Gfo/Idh/MocA family oxidoreductase, partial [Acidimicrobiales bacterium]|nr:Gfo/Idh/MocA family oxidoreductase [Acidimicrobiales bacterium]